MVGVARGNGIALIPGRACAGIGIAMDGQQQLGSLGGGPLGTLAGLDAGTVRVLAFLLGDGQVGAEPAVRLQQVGQLVGGSPGNLIITEYGAFRPTVHPAL